MKIPLTIFLSFFMSLGCVSAQEREGQLKSDNMVGQFSYPLARDRGEVFVVVRDDVHLKGKNFQVDLRPNCGNKNVNLTNLEVMDAETACTVEMDSFVHDKVKEQLSVKIAKNCGDEPEVFTFNLKRLCKGY